jgi:hypothetical protein
MLLKRKKGVYVIVPKHSAKPSFVCSGMSGIAKQLGVHKMTVQLQFAAMGYYSGKNGTAYLVPILRKEPKNDTEQNDTEPKKIQAKKIKTPDGEVVKGFKI